VNCCFISTTKTEELCREKKYARRLIAGSGTWFTETERDCDRALRDRDGSSTTACRNGREGKWKTSPVQHISTNYNSTAPK